MIVCSKIWLMRSISTLSMGLAKSERMSSQMTILGCRPLVADSMPSPSHSTRQDFSGASSLSFSPKLTAKSMMDVACGLLSVQNRQNGFFSMSRFSRVTCSSASGFL